MSAVRHSTRSPSKNTLLKVVILGDGGVGKSCLMNRFVSNQFDEHSFHTIGVEFLNKDVEIDSETYTLQIWDTAGQERFKTLRTPFYRGSDICMLTYAVDDRSDVTSEEREVTQLEMEMWCNENSITSCIETSAKNASNVQEAFKMAVQHWLRLETRADRNESPINDTVDLTKNNTSSRVSCCMATGDE
nr:unnamed protein product [Callosobruchus chinensis]